MAVFSNPWIKRLLSVVGYVVAAVAVITAVDWYRASDIEQQVPEQSANVLTLQGDRVDIIGASQQQPVLLYFWATWCPYCKVVSPMVDSVAADNKVLSVAFSSGTDAEVTQFITEHGYQFDTVNDQTGVLAKRWGVTVTPTLLVIRQGKVVSVTTGLTSSMGMRARLELAR